MVSEEKQEHRIERNKGTWRRYGRRAKWPNRLAMIVGYAVVFIAIMEAVQPDDPPAVPPASASVPSVAAAVTPTRPRVEPLGVLERPARAAPEPELRYTIGKQMACANKEVAQEVRQLERPGMDRETFHVRAMQVVRDDGFKCIMIAPRTAVHIVQSDVIEAMEQIRLDGDIFEDKWWVPFGTAGR